LLNLDDEVFTHIYAEKKLFLMADFMTQFFLPIKAVLQFLTRKEIIKSIKKQLKLI